MQTTETRMPAQIVVGPRHRKDLGDLNELAASISARNGLLHPIAITPANELIAGARRLRAWTLPACKFRDQPIPVHVVDIDAIVAGEWDENAIRKDFLPSEAVAIMRALLPREKAMAHERQWSGKSQSTAQKGSAGDRVARFIGKSRRTLEKAQAVVAAAEREPHRFGELARMMDATGSVDAAHRRLSRAEKGGDNTADGAIKVDGRPVTSIKKGELLRLADTLMDRAARLVSEAEFLRRIDAHTAGAMDHGAAVGELVNRRTLARLHRRPS